MKISLASNSPRRIDILKDLEVPFDTVGHHFDEEAVPFDGDPVAHAILLSEGKARTAEGDVVLAADTVVYFRGKLYGKPASREEAKQFLSDLAGNCHSVYTALTITKDEQCYSKVEETLVYFNDFSLQEIDDYLDTIEWHDKAGGYAVQGAGARIVKKIDGCFYNVMGLPINALHSLLKRIDLE